MFSDACSLGYGGFAGRPKAMRTRTDWYLSYRFPPKKWKQDEARAASKDSKVYIYIARHSLAMPVMPGVTCNLIETNADHLLAGTRPASEQLPQSAGRSVAFVGIVCASCKRCQVGVITARFIWCLDTCLASYGLNVLSGK